MQDLRKCVLLKKQSIILYLKVTLRCNVLFCFCIGFKKWVRGYEVKENDHYHIEKNLPKVGLYKNSLKGWVNGNDRTMPCDEFKENYC